MPKRKEPEKEAVEKVDEDESASEESSSEDDTDMLDIDFEWFDPQPQVDFHGIKTLLRQLFDADAQLLDLSALTDIILAQPLLGSTVKVDGNETDPYAFLSVLSLYEHRNKPAIMGLVDYVCSRSLASEKTKVVPSLVRGDGNARVGLVLTERLINIPTEVTPPMYKMLLEEITWAQDEGEPYHFTHYLILSKTYLEIASLLADADETTPKQKKAKKAEPKGALESFYFHPEDQVLHNVATTYADYTYKIEANQSDSKRAFQDLGIKPQGHMILIESEKLQAAVQAMLESFGQS